ncbi:uncharacterized protein MONBRDRAFT_39233 [Monosiga brevicollis MX1]|uniref:Fascin n=1 Tax=Monosiga brevicollis TaxID=81824 RepID=A9VD21_MONBE|nr:uncharacterized protein MONBRDRAFT_39233 [Monosiga brevicollis MX1]EDQ84601.1 predicted protein [Monosiga brevicollis MX1]|eukprot:XP_001750628.1 hypothetical protein [Monosiga brevicollis MX1]
MARNISMTMGLRNASSGLYLTQETFGFAVNCNGKSLKKKQTLTLVAQDGGIHFKTHLNKFLYGDRDGNVKADADAPSAETQWTILPQADGTWALKSAAGFFFHGTGDKLTAFVGGDDVPADGRWVVHLAMHPQINLYNAMRKRYVHLSTDGELQCNEDVPWGEDALLNLIFFEEHPTGRYGLMACNGKYLENSGKLVDAPNGNCQFLLGFHDDHISLCDDEGRFLSCVGGKGTVRVNKQKVTKDELFRIQDSEPQFIIRNIFKNLNVSARNGAEVKADQKLNDVQDTERFQFEVADGEVHVMSDKLKYWAPRDDGSLAVETEKKSANTAFVVDYSAGNTVKFQHKASGKFLIAKPNGAMFATGDASDEAAAFELAIINRPTLILRGQYGFLGVKGASGRVECNRSHPDVFNLVSKNGEYYLQKDGKYWTVDQDGVACVSSSPVAFFFEFVQLSKALIKHKESGKYIIGEQNGGFKANGDREETNTLWEF